MKRDPNERHFGIQQGCDNQSCNQRCINYLSNDNLLGWSKFIGSADEKINVTQKLKFSMGRVESIVGKGENAGYQHFLLFRQCFQKASYIGFVRSRDYVVKG